MAKDRDKYCALGIGPSGECKKCCFQVECGMFGVVVEAQLPAHSDRNKD